MIKLVLVESSHNYVIPFWPDHISHTLKISPFWRTVWRVETSFHDVFFKFVGNISTRAVSSCHIITKEAVFIFWGPSEAELWSRGPNDLCKMSSWGWRFWLAKIVLTNLVIPSVRRKRKKKKFFLRPCCSRTNQKWVFPQNMDAFLKGKVEKREIIQLDNIYLYIFSFLGQSLSTVE